MQSILNLLTVLAFIMSATTWLLTAYNRSIRVSCNVIDFIKYDRGIIQLFMYIQNNSEKPLTISGMSLVIDCNRYPCELISKKIRTVNDVIVQATPNFPLNFSPAQGRMEFFEFLHCPDIEASPGKTVVIEIYTNRKPLKRLLTLPQSSPFYHHH